MSPDIPGPKHRALFRFIAGRIVGDIAAGGRERAEQFVTYYLDGGWIFWQGVALGSSTNQVAHVIVLYAVTTGQTAQLLDGCIESLGPQEHTSAAELRALRKQLLGGAR